MTTGFSGRARPLAALAALSVLAGCAGATVISPPSYGRYSASDFAYAAAGRDLHVVVRGNPSGLTDAAFAQATVDAMQGKHAGPVNTRFSLTPNPDRPDYRVILLFDAPGSASAASVCRGTAPIAAVSPRDRPVTLTAAFCWRDDPLSDLMATGPALGPDPRLQLASFMGSVMPILLPVENPLYLKGRGESRR